MSETLLEQLYNPQHMFVLGLVSLIYIELVFTCLDQHDPGGAASPLETSRLVLIELSHPVPIHFETPTVIADGLIDILGKLIHLSMTIRCEVCFFPYLMAEYGVNT